MARILLGVSGGIAAYKALELTRLAIKSGHSVRVVQTPDSERFVGRASFEGITGAPVMVSQFDRDPLGGVFTDQPRPSHDPISHLELAANCDVFVVAPATANTIAKLAAGMADNMLTTLALGCSKPLVVAPAMNNEMYLNAATQANVGTLRDRGAVVIEPEVGELASKGEYGVGRLVEPAEILQRVEAVLASSTERGAFAPRSLDGLRVLITAGGTREPIDSVRFVGNRSSGRMGFALASEAASRGAKVTVIAANVSLEHDQRVEYVDVQTAVELEAAANTHFASTDVLVMAAAVADFRPTESSSQKIKKAGRETLELTLTATNDILSGLAAQRKDGQLLVGFAAETGPEMLAEAERKRATKGLDLVVANDVGNAAIGFEVDQNAVSLVAADGDVQHVALASKTQIAAAILDRVEQLLVAQGTQRPSKPIA